MAYWSLGKHCGHAADKAPRSVYSRSGRKVTSHAKHLKEGPEDLSLTQTDIKFQQSTNKVNCSHKLKWISLMDDITAQL